jgi:hypothetical protein
MAAPTLDGRLLCACNCTYAVAADGLLDLPADDTYYNGAGFLQPPATFVGGDAQIDACLVGAIPDGVVVAFRGTLPLDIHRYPTLLDWFNDFNANPAAVDGYPGFVHPGFAGALDAVWDRAVAEVQKQRVGAAAAVPLLVTGHSKGGAMAALAAWRFQTALNVPTKVVGFAAAKPGDAAFRDAYNQALDHTRYEDADDIVPHLPPSQNGFLKVLSSLPVVGDRFAGLARFDYQQVGVLRYIDASGDIEAETPTLAAERALSLIQLILWGRFSQIAADHAIGCGSGYMTAVCPAGVCPPLVPGP